MGLESNKKNKYDELLSEIRLDVEIYQLQPSLDIKRRTVFVNVWQIAVAQYLCIRVGEAEALMLRCFCVMATSLLLAVLYTE